MKWHNANKIKPKTSTSTDIYRVLIFWSFDFEKMPGRISFGWWNESCKRWYCEGTNSQIDVKFWHELPPVPELDMEETT